MQIAQLRQQNRALRQRIADFKKQKQLGPGLKNEIQKFVSESKKNLTEMNERSMAEQQKSNKKLHELTQKYQTVLKEQISQLTNNKTLSQKREALDKRTNDQVQKLTKEYEQQISDFEKKVKVNVKKIQQMGSNNIIKRLIKNEKFKKAMAERGCDLSGLEKQSELEQIAQQVEQQQKLIQAAETKSATLDEELEKMQELIETMKELMENMQKEKQNILKQNNILKEKLEQSEELIGKLLGKNPDGQEDPVEDGEDQK